MSDLFPKILRIYGILGCAMYFWIAEGDKIKGIRLMVNSELFTLSEAYRAWNLYEKTINE